MRHRIILFSAVLCLMSAALHCRAQSRLHTSLEFDFDVRSRITDSGKSLAGLYSTSVRSQTHLAPGLQLQLYGARKDAHLLTLPASSDFILQQATLEKDWGSQRVQLGLIRLPFGIYDYRETYATGLIDYPMARVDYALNSVNWGVPGAQWTGGTSHSQLEVALFDGRASGVWGNIHAMGGGAVRAQTYVRDFVVGASRWDGYFDRPDTDTSGGYGAGNVSAVFSGPVIRTGVHMNGFDMRYTRPHLLLRGEYLFGILGDELMQGWYLDAYYHLPKYEKITFVGRVEELRPDSSDPSGKQLTLGVRYTATSDLTLAVNWRHNNMNQAYSASWTPYAGPGGDIFLQAYYKLRFR